MKKILLFLLFIAFVCSNNVNGELLLLGAYLRPTGTSDIISRIIDAVSKIYFKIKNIIVRK